MRFQKGVTTTKKAPKPAKGEMLFRFYVDAECAISARTEEEAVAALRTQMKSVQFTAYELGQPK